MRQGEPLAAQLESAQEQQVQVDRARPVPGAGEGAPVLDLDRLADVQKLIGAERGPHPGDGVEEVGLVEDLSNRLGLVERGDRLDLDVMSTEVGDRLAQVRLTIPDVRAEPDVADPLGPAPLLAQIPCSSPGSRSTDPSRVTSTPASSTV